MLTCETSQSLVSWSAHRQNKFTSDELLPEERTSGPLGFVAAGTRRWLGSRCRVAAIGRHLLVGLVPVLPLATLNPASGAFWCPHLLCERAFLACCLPSSRLGSYERSRLARAWACPAWGSHQACDPVFRGTRLFP